jgi:hypothetical protein
MMADARLQTLLDRLNVPTQDLAELSFCGGSKEPQVREWARTLPLTRINHVSALLYKAVPEISRLKTSSETRLAILEALRPAVQQCIQGLSQHFLNQPLILPEAARKTATVAQALQKHMSNGYLVAVRDLCQAGKRDTAEAQGRQALAIARALTGLGLLLLRSYQLYTPIAGQLWTEMHTLYEIADALDLTEHPIHDALPHHQHINTISHAYLRVMLLACAKPNQMRQDEVLATYHALENLCHLGQLLPHNPAQKDNLFAIQLSSNRPPLYKSRLPNNPEGEIRELNTSQLARTLQEQSNQTANNADASNLRNALNLSASLNEHLIQAWNILAQRSFERQETSGHIEVTVGLTNLHFHISGKQPFNLFLNQTANVGGEENAEAIFKKRGIQLKPGKPTEEDPWGDAFDVGGTTLAGQHLPTLNIENTIRKQQQQDYLGKHPVHKVPIVDVSPGGYCLEWQEEIPSQVKAGELLGVRDEGRQKWGIGVVRWVQQTKGATQLGIQILAPQAIPLGVAIVHKTGGYSEYLRALQLPALKAINQPVTLLTNSVSFREYSKVRLFRPASPESDDQRNGNESTVQLTRRVFATGAFSQFTYRELMAAKAETTNSKDDFDSVWQKN